MCIRSRTLTPARAGSLLALLLILPVLAALVATIICPPEGDPYRLVRISAWMAIGSHGLAMVALMFVHRGALGTAAAAAAYACLGVSSAITVPCVSVVGRRLPDENRASVFSLLEALLIGGQAVGVLLAGRTVTHFGAGRVIAVLLLPAVLASVVGIGRLHSLTLVTAEIA